MDFLLITNIAILLVAVASIIILMVLLCKAEKKLAKYGESWMYKRKGGNRR